MATKKSFKTELNPAMQFISVPQVDDEPAVDEVAVAETPSVATAKKEVVSEPVEPVGGVKSTKRSSMKTAVAERPEAVASERKEIGIGNRADVDAAQGSGQGRPFSNASASLDEPRAMAPHDGAYVPAATAGYRTNKAPAGFKPNPMYIETKSRRLQLLMQPSLFERVKVCAAADGVSVNEWIHGCLESACGGVGE